MKPEGIPNGPRHPGREGAEAYRRYLGGNNNQCTSCSPKQGLTIPAVIEDIQEKVVIFTDWASI